MEYSESSKSQLAKLLATENINIEFRANTKIAYFDLQKRILVCPIWKNMDGYLYDLILGHEVSHALNTPPEGWHDVVTEKGPKYKHFLNVIEDARIERMIKQRYPGIKKSFVEGYKNLFEQDFFGIKDKDIETLFFIDKINLYMKSCGIINPHFSEKEKEMLDMVENTQTWNDVLKVTDIIFEYSKDEQFPEIEGEGEDIIVETEDRIPSCMTDENFRKNEEILLDKNCKNYYRLSIPKPNLKSIINKPETVYKHIFNHISLLKGLGYDVTRYDPAFVKNEFHGRNDRYISLLVKEFEMRKAAKKYARTKISETGDLNINKICRYQIEDDIFKKAMLVADGKSHGMIMLLDRSASMSNYIAACIEQILIMIHFCKRVNIPFVVYGFHNGFHNNVSQTPEDSDFEELGPQFSDDQNDLKFDNFRLREIVNSNLSNEKYNKAITGLMILEKLYTTDQNVPVSESMSSTPLHEALCAIDPIIKDFKKKNNVQIVNLLIVQDGDSDTTNAFYNPKDSKDYRFTAFDHQGIKDRIVVYDKETNIEETMSETKSLTSCMINIIKRKYNCNVIGYFLVGKGKHAISKFIMNYYYDKKGNKFNNKNGDTSLISKKLTEDKYLESYIYGYNRFFVTHTDKTIFNEEDLDDYLDDYFENVYKITSKQLATVLTKFNNKRAINRIFINKFIQQIID
jgi:hypothetical protein